MYDHRGHGTDKKLSELGFVAEQKGFTLLIKDGIEVLKFVKRSMRTEKLILFSYSMGSLIGRNVIQYYHELDAVVFYATASPGKLKNIFGIISSNLIAKFKGQDHKSDFLKKAMFETKLFSKLCERTAYDWLTRSNPAVGAYIHDPYCGFTCSASFYRDVVMLSYYAGQRRRIVKAQIDLPILFLSGSKDPVGNYGKDVTRLFNLYQRLGFQHVNCTLYKDCRHELLSELNAQEIMNDIVAWFQG
jgi:alpha-beta hydrolase superfamily lysophospholipase